MTPVLVLAAISAAVVVTSFISGILGMAGGMILMGILLALQPVAVAMMLHGITQLASNAWRGLLWRDKVDWRIFRGYLYGALATLAVYAVLKLVVSKPVALLVMGLTPFVSLALPEKLHLNVERPWHPVACGTVCTALALMAGVSGPILDVFFVRSKMGRHAVVATKAMTQSLSHILKIVYFGAIVAVEGGEKLDPWLAGVMVALALTGTSISRHVLDRMNDKSFRLWTRWTVMSLGFFYLASGVWMLAR